MWLQPRQRWKEKVTALQFFINARLFVLWRPLELIYDHLSFNLCLSSHFGCPHAQKCGWFIVVNLKCNVWPFAQKSLCESNVIAWRTFMVIYFVWVLSEYRVTLVITWCSTKNSEIKCTGMSVRLSALQQTDRKLEEGCVLQMTVVVIRKEAIKSWLVIACWLNITLYLSVRSKILPLCQPLIYYLINLV